jgi:C-terminal processing protease CtpA/Prc
LVAVRVLKIEAGSPAATGGLRVGDEILAIDGKKLAGTNARAAADLLKVRPGQSLRLQIRRDKGEEQDLTLVAGVPKKPASGT